MAVNIVSVIDDIVKVRRVLASVSDKNGLADLVRDLINVNHDVVIYSTGGTYAAISAMDGIEPGRNLVAVSDYTGQPEMQGGLVKTLDFKIYLGLLSETYNEAHTYDLNRIGAVPIDMVVVNLYPFEATIAKADATVEHARANIDIGGPCMVRAAAKNFLRVASVTDPGDYESIVAEMRANSGGISLRTRFMLARKAFAHTAKYDRVIAEYFAKNEYSAVRRAYTTIH